MYPANLLVQLVAVLQPADLDVPAAAEPTLGPPRLEFGPCRVFIVQIPLLLLRCLIRIHLPHLGLTLSRCKTGLLTPSFTSSTRWVRSL